MRMEKVFNKTITMYSRYQDISTGQWTTIRTAIPFTNWQENSVGLFNMTGQTQSNNVNVTILRYRGENEPVMLTQNEWNALPRDEVETGKYFVAVQSTYTIYLPFEHNYIFPWYTTTGLLTTAETTFKNGLQPTGTPAVYRSSRDVSVNFYGVRRIQNAQFRLA